MIRNEFLSFFRIKLLSSFIASKIKNEHNKQLIESLYKILLNRNYDEHGFETWLEKLNTGSTYDEVVKGFISSEEFKIRLPQMIIQSAIELPMLASFSEFQEDQKLILHLVNSNFHSPYVVDVGAHSIFNSNSFIFSQLFGWPTILIEANVDLIPDLQKHFPNNTKIFNLAIGVNEKLINFYVNENSFVSSFDKKASQQWNKKVRKTEIPMRRLHHVLDENNVPLNFGLLTIDIEGLDELVLEDLLLNSRYRPQIIIGELANQIETEINLNRFINQEMIKIYRVIAKTQANVIWELR